MNREAYLPTTLWQKDRSKADTPTICRKDHKRCTCLPTPVTFTSHSLPFHCDRSSEYC